MNIEITNKTLNKFEADIKVIFVINKNLEHKTIKDNESLTFLGYKGESEEVALLVDKKLFTLDVNHLMLMRLDWQLPKLYLHLKKLMLKLLKLELTPMIALVLASKL